MRRHIGLAFASAIALGIGGAGTAVAADLPMKAPPPPVAVFSWAGWYMGADAGAAWSRVTETHSPFFPAVAGATLLAFPVDTAAVTAASSPRFSTVGATGGLYGGYNFQSGNIVYGVEADISGMSLMNSNTGVFPFPSTPGTSFAASTSYRTNWEATLRGRLGIVAANDWLFYATGGGAVADEKIFQNSGSLISGVSLSRADFTNTRGGWVVGGGIEHAFTPNWIMRIEYLHSDFGTAHNGAFENFPTATSNNVFCTPNTTGAIVPAGTVIANGCSISTRMTTDVVRVGLSYKFGGPVVAKY
jgi:outer membrane immunogenic protein